MDFNSDDKDRILKGLESYLRECIKDSKDDTRLEDEREYFRVEANEVEELIDRISS